MKNLIGLLFLSLFTSSNLVISSGDTVSFSSIKDNYNESDSIIIDRDSISDTSPNFEFAYKAFKYYNPNIDTLTVVQFVKVCEFYNLDTTKLGFRLYVGQILIESGAKHYKNGRVIIGGGGHIGIAQISPKSGLAIMKKLVNDNDINDFRLLSGDSTLTIPKTYSEMVSWLSDKDNNLMFWGYMMSRNCKYGSAESALVRYNAGPGGYQSYINSGHNVNNHHYIIGIKNKLSKVI